VNLQVLTLDEAGIDALLNQESNERLLAGLE
jgi:hypothetical protein